ncbi:MAG: tetratricopeptide repeat protein [Pyrinomonadaceae bacterium]
MSKDSRELYEFGEFCLDVGERRLERFGGASNAALPEKAFQTLVHLVRNRGTLVTKEELLSTVWPDSIVEENNLGKAIYSIRQFLGDRSTEPKYIETIPKHGYRFVALVRSFDRDGPVGEGSGGGFLGIPRDRNTGFRTAFEAVQQARVRYCQMTAPTTLEARRLISEAMTIDRDFIPALSLSAELATLEVIVGLKEPHTGFREARAALRRARDLRADSAEYFSAVGYVDLIAGWDFRSAEANLKKALGLNPHSATANRMLGETYMFQGRDVEALTHIDRAQTDDLAGIHNANILAIAHFLGGRYQQAIEVCQKMLAVSPGHIIPAWTICWAQEQMGLEVQALAGYDRLLKRPDGQPALRWAGYAFAIAGDRARAFETAARLEEAMKEHITSPTHLAAVYGALGETKRAMDFVEQAYEMRDPFVLWLGKDPRFDSLRTECRFEAIVDKVGFFHWKHRDGSTLGESTEGSAASGASGLPFARPTESGAHILVGHSDWAKLLERFDAVQSDSGDQPGETKDKIGDLEADAETSIPHSFTVRSRHLPMAAATVAAVLLISSVWLATNSSLFSYNPSTPGSPDPSLNLPGLADNKDKAYDLYVRGKVKVANENRADTEAAIALLQEAVSLNPNLAEAFAQLARAHNTMAFKFSAGPDRKQHHENAEVAIEKALKLNRELAEAHFARGLILWTNTNRFPHEQSISAYKRSLAIDPNSDETHHQLSLVYSHIGLEDKAFASVRKALELNPNNTLARFRIGVYLQYEGRFDEAIAVFKTIPREEHTPLLMDRSLGETLIQLGRLQEAEAIADEHLSRFPQDEGGSFTSIKALVLAKTGEHHKAEERILKANEIGSGFGHFHHTAYNIASAYAVMGRPDEAVRWLETAADGGFPNYPYFSLDPNLERLRKHPRFVAFMTKLRSQWERFKNSD